MMMNCDLEHAGHYCRFNRNMNWPLWRDSLDVGQEVEAMMLDGLLGPLADADHPRGIDAHNDLL